MASKLPTKCEIEEGKEVAYLAVMGRTKLDIR